MEIKCRLASDNTVHVVVGMETRKIHRYVYNTEKIRDILATVNAQYTFGRTVVTLTNLTQRKGVNHNQEYIADFGKTLQDYGVQANDTVLIMLASKIDNV